VSKPFRGPRVGLYLALGVGLIPGCGNPYQMAKVRGRVLTCEGKPAVGGEVEFWPIDAPDKTGRRAGNPGQVSRAVVGPDGTFTLVTTGIQGAKDTEGAVVGPQRVKFNMPPTRRPVMTAEERAAGTPEHIKALEEEAARMPIYPPLPCSNKIEPAEVEVKPGDNTFEFTLPPKK
jgi:hypothetical protein